MMIGSRMICIVICIIAVGAERSIDFLSLPSLPFDGFTSMNTMHLYLSHGTRNSLLLLTPRYLKDTRTSYPFSVTIENVVAKIEIT